jgi:hypothetical protein
MRIRSRFWARGARFAVLVLVLCAGCRAEPTYEQAILAARAEKDLAFKEGRESPLEPGDRASFSALVYFPPDESYRVAAALKPPAPGEPPSATMPTSAGKLREMRRMGSLEFNLKGEPLKLTAFTEATEAIDVGARRLFVPFGDLTNGTETYPAGRYLDLDPTPTGLYGLDFNRAYNPFCAYNERYDCPYPPRENRLRVPVRAGEKAWRPLIRGQRPGTRGQEQGK